MANVTSAVMTGRSMKMREKFMRTAPLLLHACRLLGCRHDGDTRAREQPQLAVGDHRFAGLTPCR